MERLYVGSVELIALVDNVAGWPLDSVYRGSKDDLAAAARHAPEGNVILNFACFLLRDAGTTILVDTGWGPEHDGRLLQELDAAGVDRNSVDIVTFTHLHGDHTGWNLDRQGGWPLFPNARYLVPEKDWRHYSGEANPAGSFARDMVPLESAGVLDLFDGDRTLTQSVTAVPTPGHTPGHTSFVVTSGGQRGYVLGDVVLGYADAENLALENTFDWDSAIAADTRKRVVAQLVGDGSIVGGSHLPAPGLGRFVRVDGGQAWQGYTPGA